MAKRPIPRVIAGVSLLLLITTVAVWYFTRQVVNRETQRLFNHNMTTVESWVTNRFETYATILYGLQGFLEGNEAVTKNEWSNYMEKLKIQERFQGITSVGLTKRFDEDYLVHFVYPEERSKAIGFNLASETNRLEALEKARDENTLAITRRVFLAADQAPGFLIMVPFYQRGAPTDTVEERRAAIENMIVVTFQSETVFNDLFGRTDPFPNLDFELFKGETTTDENLLYDHDKAFYVNRDNLGDKNLQIKKTILLNGEKMTLIASAKPSFGLTNIEQQLPTVVLITGVVFDLLISIFALSRYQKLEKRKTLRPQQ